MAFVMSKELEEKLKQQEQAIGASQQTLQESAANISDPARKQAAYDKTMEGKGRFSRLMTGAGDLLGEADTKFKQLVLEGADMTGSDTAGAQLQASRKGVDAEREAMDGISDPWRTGGYYGAAAAPAVGAMIATRGQATPNLTPLWQSALASMGVSAGTGFATRPEGERDATTGERVANAGIDSLLGLLGPAGGALGNYGRMAFHNARRALPEEAIPDFFRRQTGHTDVPLPSNVAPKTFNEQSVRANLAEAIRRPKARASAMYDRAKMLAGNDPIELTATRNFTNLVTDDAGALMAARTSPAVAKLLTGGRRISNTMDNSVQPPVQISDTATLEELIEAQKSVSRSIRGLQSGASPNEAGAEYLRRLQTAIEQDINRWGSTGMTQGRARAAYEAGRGIYRNDVVPITSPSTVTGQVFKNGEFPEGKIRDLFGTGAGTSVSRAIAENPYLTSALRRQFGDMSMEHIGNPEGISKLFRNGSTVENIMTPEELNWMQMIAHNQDSVSTGNAVKQAMNAAVRSAPLAGGAASGPIDRLWRGVDAFGQTPFQATSNQLLRLLGGSSVVAASNKERQ